MGAGSVQALISPGVSPPLLPSLPLVVRSATGSKHPRLVGLLLPFSLHHWWRDAHLPWSPTSPPQRICNFLSSSSPPRHHGHPPSLMCRRIRHALPPRDYPMERKACLCLEWVLNVKPNELSEIEEEFKRDYGVGETKAPIPISTSPTHSVTTA